MYPSSQFGRHYVPKGTVVAEAGTSWGAATPAQKEWRRTNRYYGPGAYSAGRNWRKFSQSIGLASAGRRLLRAGTDAAIGLIGQGAYGNSLIASDSVAPEVPQVISEADETGAITVSRREFITDIYAPAVGVKFENNTYALNPGLEACFPWLSQIAQNYDEYSFDQLIFHFRSTVTDVGNSTTGQCGTVILVTNYNSAAPEFTDKGAMQAYDGAMSCKTTESLTHGVECDDRKRAGLDDHYVRAGPVPTGQDVKTYDHGTFQLAVANTPDAYAGQSIGELWVSYTVKLAKPKFGTSRGSNIQRDIFVSGAGSETNLLPMGTSDALLRGAQNSMGCTLVLTSNRIRVNFAPEFAGTVELIISFEGGGCGTSPFGSPANFAFGGQVEGINDIYGARDSATATDGPLYYTTPITATGGAGSGWPTNALNGMCAVWHLRVKPMTGGVTNYFETQTSFTAAPGQGMVDIHEYNAGFSSRALGIGPIEARSDAPILINAQGAQVVPA